MARSIFTQQYIPPMPKSMMSTKVVVMVDPNTNEEIINGKIEEVKRNIRKIGFLNIGNNPISIIKILYADAPMTAENMDAIYQCDVFYDITSDDSTSIFRVIAETAGIITVSEFVLKATESHAQTLTREADAIKIIVPVSEFRNIKED